MENIDLDAKRRERPSEITITIGGETFRARTRVRPEATLEWDDFYFGEDTSQKRQIEVADLTIKRFLVADDHGKYDALRANEDDPLTSQDLSDIVRALQEAAVGRPTEASSDSSPGTPDDAASSTDASSSPEATPTP